MCGKWNYVRTDSYPYPNTRVRGRWVICFNCDGYGQLYMHDGDQRKGTGLPCEWCDETGKRWDEKSSSNRKSK